MRTRSFVTFWLLFLLAAPVSAGIIILKEPMDGTRWIIGPIEAVSTTRVKPQGLAPIAKDKIAHLEITPADPAFGEVTKPRQSAQPLSMEVKETLVEAVNELRFETRDLRIEGENDGAQEEAQEDWRRGEALLNLGMKLMDRGANLGGTGTFDRHAVAAAADLFQSAQNYFRKAKEKVAQARQERLFNLTAHLEKVSKAVKPLEKAVRDLEKDLDKTNRVARLSELYDLVQACDETQKKLVKEVERLEEELTPARINELGFPNPGDIPSKQSGTLVGLRTRLSAVRKELVEELQAVEPTPVDLLNDEQSEEVEANHFAFRLPRGWEYDKTGDGLHRATGPSEENVQNRILIRVLDNPTAITVDEARKRVMDNLKERPGYTPEAPRDHGDNGFLISGTYEKGDVTIQHRVIGILDAQTDSLLLINCFFPPDERYEKLIDAIVRKFEVRKPSKTT